MQLSTIPAKIAAIFAASAAPTSKNTIPLTQAGITQPGQASFDVGFPAVTMQPAASGGINPYGQDFNGLGFAVTGVQQWQCAGGGFPFDAAFATTVGGYPKGAVVLSATGDGYWLCLADNNSTNPDTGGANWAPIDSYGITPVTGLTNANVTLTAPQYSKPVITLAGTLTGNVQIIFPTLMQEWLVINNTTGAFTVTAKTAAGSGVIISQAGGMQTVQGDGTNLLAMGGNSSVPLLVGPGTQATHAAQMSQLVGVVGSVRNLRAGLAAAAASVAFTADEVVVESALGGIRYCIPNFNKTLNISTTGAGGMDTGSAPVSGWVATYALLNPATGASNVVGVNSTSSVAPEVYGGANMPSGFTASALISVLPTTAGSLLGVFRQYDREVFYFNAPYNGGGGTGAFVSLSIAAAVPKNAYRWKGNLAITQTATTGNCSAAVCPTSAGQGTPGYVAVQTYSNAGQIAGAHIPECPIFTAQTTFWIASGQGGQPAAMTINSYGYTF